MGNRMPVRNIESLLRQSTLPMPSAMERRIRVQLDVAHLRPGAVPPVPHLSPQTTARRAPARFAPILAAAAGTGVMCAVVLTVAGLNWSGLETTQRTEPPVAQSARPLANTSANLGKVTHSQRGVALLRVVHSTKRFDYVKTLGFKPTLSSAMPVHYVLTRLEAHVHSNGALAPERSFTATYQLPSDLEQVIVVKEQSVTGHGGIPQTVNLPRWRPMTVQGHSVFFAWNSEVRSVAMAEVKDTTLREIVMHLAAPTPQPPTRLLEEMLFHMDRPVTTWPDALVQNATGLRAALKLLTFSPQFPSVLPAQWKAAPARSDTAWTTKSAWVTRETFTTTYLEDKIHVQLFESLGRTRAALGASTIHKDGRTFSLITSTSGAPYHVLSWYDARRNITYSLDGAPDVKHLLQVAAALPG